MNIVACLTLTFGLVAMVTGKPVSKRPQRIVDMTHLLTDDFPYWPGNRPSFMLNLTYAGLHNGRVYIESNMYHTSEHGGTHYDAPAHFCNLKGCWRTQDVPAERLIGPGVIIDVKEQAEKDPDYGVSVGDLQNWERKHGTIPKGAFIMMNSGYYKYTKNVTKFFGTATGNTSDMHFPGFHPEATKWLLDNREIYAIGVDSLSLDPGNSSLFMSHRLALGRNVIGFENVNNLDDVPEAGAMIYAFPIFIKNGTGGQTRIMATWDDDGTISGAPRHVIEAIIGRIRIPVLGDTRVDSTRERGCEQPRTDTRTRSCHSRLYGGLSGVERIQDGGRG